MSQSIEFPELVHGVRTPNALRLQHAHRLWACRALAIIAVALALLRAASTIETFNNNCDEPFHISAAVGLYDLHKLISGTEQPPVSRLVAAIPLYFSGVHIPPGERGSAVISEAASFVQGSEELMHSGVPYETILFRTRLAMLVFPALALLYVYLLGRWLIGEIPALLALVFFSTDPGFLGHSMWVGTDMAACAGYLAAAYYGMRWVMYRGHGRAAAAATAVALAFSSKFSCFIIAAALLAMILLRPLPRMIAKRDRSWKACTRRWPRLREWMVFLIVGFFVLWATYLFNIGALNDQSAFGPSNKFWSTWERLPAWIKCVPIPMPSLPLGLIKLMGHLRYGHVAYLNGEVRIQGWWYYFPETIALKSPLALLAGLLIAAVLLLRKPRPQLLTMLALLLPAIVFMAAAMKGNVDIGIRHILPVIPFLYLIVSSQLVRARLTPLLLALIALAFVETASAHPDYSSYFNVAAGSEAGGSRYLLDSNIEYGQYVGELAHWLRAPARADRLYSTRLFMYPVASLMGHYGLDPAAATRVPSGFFCISKNVENGLLGPSQDDLET
ncbi:MAG: glycosyltransferase family 39 protein, partial [Phycisphaerae bacterium]|nr:glycosyltransferase family 39 protein [Phycisphaerae bacterium]